VASAVAVGVRVVVGHAAVDLRRQDHSVALAVSVERLAGDLLARAVRVDVRGVEEIDACVERPVDDRVRIVRTCASPEHHAPEADRADLDTSAT
jgi:hypothetical protein